MEQSISDAARALGKIGGKSKSPKKLNAIAKNLDKANKALDSNARKERAKKAAIARWSKASQNATKNPKTKTESK